MIYLWNSELNAKIYILHCVTMVTVLFQAEPTAGQASEGPRGFICRYTEARPDHQRLCEVCGSAGSLYQVTELFSF